MAKEDKIKDFLELLTQIFHPLLKTIKIFGVAD